MFYVLLTFSMTHDVNRRTRACVVGQDVDSTMSDRKKFYVIPGETCPALAL